MDATHNPHPRLTLREHRATWMLARGFSTEEMARELKIQNHSVSQLLDRARRKTPAPNRYAYVAYAVLSGLVGPELDCGRSLAAYKRHNQRDEPPCPACRRFHELRNTALYDRDPRAVTVEVVFTRREMQVLDALAAGADSMREIGDKLGGLDRKRVASHLSSLYDKVGVPHRDNRDRRRVLLYLARQRGLYPLPDGTFRAAQGRVLVPPQMRLSPKQAQLLLACEDGAPLRVVGERLGLPREAVSARLSEVYRRLGVGPGADPRNNASRRDRRREAARRAREFGLLM